VHGISATPLGLALAREIDDDRAHDASRVREEVATFGAGEFSRALEAQEALVQQHRRVEQRVAAPVAKLRARLPAQILVGHGEQPFARGFVAGLRPMNQL
jgi:hypothetical protein